MQLNAAQQERITKTLNAFLADYIKAQAKCARELADTLGKQRGLSAEVISSIIRQQCQDKITYNVGCGATAELAGRTAFLLAH